MAKLIPGVNDLATVNPELAKEWHPTKNGDLKPSDVLPKSGKKVWWLDKYGHEWLANVSRRTNGNGCPYCSGRLAIKGENDLATIYPRLAGEWHPMKNGDLTPDKVSVVSNKNVWWLGKCGHEWQATVANRTKRGSNCPICANKKVLAGFNDLATINPELAKEWHPTKNGVLTPQMVTPVSGKRVWWLGKCGHEWESTVANRAYGYGCPICFNEKETSFAEQAVFYYIHKVFMDAVNRENSLGKELDVYIPSLSIGIEYDGYYFHSDLMRDVNKYKWCCDNGIRLIRIREKGCPELTNGECIIRNGESDSSLTEAIRKLFNLLDIRNCDIDVVRDKSKILDHFVVTQKQLSFAEKYPDLAKEWHPTKNGNLTPDMFSYGSQHKVWWLGKCGHEWQADFNKRSSGCGCPYCSNQKVLRGFNDLATTHPELVKEWHPAKNGNVSPHDIIRGGQRMFWWKCSICGFEWQSSVSSRMDGCGCPRCGRKRVANILSIPQEGCSLLDERPDLAAEWHPIKNGSLKPSDVSVGSSKKVWWKCKNGHEWQAVISNRSNGRNCPYCSNKRLLKGFNDLATVNPDLAREWHPTKNGNLKASDVVSGSHKKVWWQCQKGHEWQVAVYQRTGGSKTGCPYCSGHVLRRVMNLDTDVVFDSLEDAARSCGLKQGDTIAMCCRGKQNTAGGYHWKFVEK